jgi:hypothetical protein
MRSSRSGSSATSVLDVAPKRVLFKDSVLDHLASIANVAQFVSFSPSLEMRYSQVRGFEPNHLFASLSDAITSLINQATEKSVNIRSFAPERPESREFVYGLRDPGEVIIKIRQLADQGLYTIVNETIDVNDGGVSGVLLGNLIEFAPQDTPRCVEKPGVASLPREFGLRLLETVYGFRPDLDFPHIERVEFSLHPVRRGVRNGHTIVWQVEEVGSHADSTEIRWPNRFSKFIGDKAFGLLIAHMLESPVPKTTVFPRWLPPFQFGSPTGTGETWIRTSPTVQQPGKFTTAPQWVDPFALMNREDESGTEIASILAQEGIDPFYSGALVMNRSGKPMIEGVAGRGDDFMVGRQGPVDVPATVRKSVMDTAAKLISSLGPIRMEWVHDGNWTWVVQLHRGAIESEGRVIVPGNPPRLRYFEVEQGIEAFREVVAEAMSKGEGVVILGNVGVTSHFGDILRKAQVPSRIAPA